MSDELTIEDAFSVIESCAGLTDESTPAGEAWCLVKGELQRLKAALPKTADGVITVEDHVGPQEVFFLHGNRITPFRVTAGLIRNPVVWQRCYSTKEAAEAALGRTRGRR